MKNVTLFYLLLLITTNSYAQALRFNGSNNYVTITNDTELHVTTFTLEAWIKPEGTGIRVSSGSGGVRAVPIITKGRGEADTPSHVNTNFFLGIDANRKLTADFEEASGANHPVISRSFIRDSIWTHVAVSYEPETAVWNLYINGVLDTTQDIGNYILPASNSVQPAAIGSALDSRGTAAGYFNGKIDEVRIWNIARTSADILKTYNAELTDGAGLVARYSFNEGTGTEVMNSIAAASSGTLTNTPLWTNGFNNKPPEAPIAPSPASGSYTAAGTTLCATSSDTNNDDLRIRFYGRKKASDAKFTIILLPDTQYYTAESRGGSNKIFKSQTTWIAKNRITRNIAYVGQLGDCTDHGDRYEVEWKRADTAIQIIEDSSETGLPEGIPYGICVGNHDQSPMFDANGSTTFYNKYFGTSRFSGRSYYGGHNGANNDNHYQLFSAGGFDFLVICFEYDQSSGFSAAEGALDWGENLIKQHPNHNVIVLSHWLLNEDNSLSTQGNAIYNRYKSYPNFMLAAAGHVHTGTGEARRSDTYNGHTVHTTLQDYQFGPNGGNGLLRIYEVDPQTSNIMVKTFSPYTNMHETDANSQFDLKVNLIRAPNPYTLVGEVRGLASGTNACVAWPETKPNEDYEWFTKIWDGEHTTTGPTWNFTTKAAVANSMTGSSQPAPTLQGRKHLSTGFVTIYPNPNNTNRLAIVFDTLQKETVRVDVFDAKGGLRIRRSFENVTTVSFEHNLPDGAYTVVVKTGSSNVTRKLIVIQ